MLAALLRRLAGGVQRKSEEGEAADVGQRRHGLRLRGHPAAERLAAGDQRHPGKESRRLGHGGTHGRVRDLRRIGPLAALLHVGELVAQRRDAALAEFGRDRRHERMVHPGARAVRQHIAGRAACGASKRPETRTVSERRS